MPVAPDVPTTRFFAPAVWLSGEELEIPTFCDASMVNAVLPPVPIERISVPVVDDWFLIKLSSVPSSLKNVI